MSRSSAERHSIPAQPGDQRERSSTRTRLVLVFILLVAALPRLVGIQENSLWFDEALTAAIIKKPFSQIPDNVRIFEQTPPLHYFLLKPWTMLVGNSEAMLRLPSAIFSIAAVAMLYMLVRRLFDEPSALIAAMLLAISPFHIYYAQEARAYSLLVFLSLLSCDLFLRLLRRKSLLLQVAYIIVTAAMIYTHLYGIFVIAAQHIAFFAFRWKGERGAMSLRTWLDCNLAVAALYLPWVPAVLEWVRGVHHWFWIQQITLDNIADAYDLYTGSRTAVLLLASLVVVALVLRRRNLAADDPMQRESQEPQEQLPAFSLLLSLTLFPVVIPVVESILLKPTFAPRYGIVASVGLYALGAVGITTFKNNIVRVALVAVLAAASALPSRLSDEKPQWREAGRYLQEHMRSEDFAVVNRKWATFIYDYYVHRPEVQRSGFEGSAVPVSLPLEDDCHVWLILYTEKYPPRIFIDRGHWRVASMKRFKDVFVLELANPESTTRPTTTQSSSSLP